MMKLFITTAAVTGGIILARNLVTPNIPAVAIPVIGKWVSVDDMATGATILLVLYLAHKMLSSSVASPV